MQPAPRSLHHCAALGDEAGVISILVGGADVNLLDEEGFTALHFASGTGHDRIVDYLIEKGADSNILAKGELALHGAAFGGHLKCAEYLVPKTNNINAITALDGLTPLHLACKSGSPELVDLLLANGALVNETSHTGHTALEICCEQGFVDIAKRLLASGARVNTVSEDGNTALLCACLCDTNSQALPTLVECLLRAGAEPNITNAGGISPLHAATIRDRTGQIAVMLVNAGARLDADMMGGTILHVAAACDNVQVAELALERKAVPVDARDSSGHTAMFAACVGKGNSLAIVDTLLKYNAKLYEPSDVGQRFNPIHGAALLGNNKIVNFFLEKGCPVDLPGKNNMTPLHIAAQRGNLDLCRDLLLKYRANIAARTADMRTALHFACENDFETLAEFLIDQCGADVTATDAQGQLPLHHSCEKRNVELSMFMIQRGANMNQKDAKGRPAIDRSAPSLSFPTLLRGEIHSKKKRKFLCF